MDHPSVFVISLDFELHWGGVEKRSVDPNLKTGQSFREYFLNTRKVIPEMLDAFSDHEVEVTWATVGLLFHESKEEMQSIQPIPLPTFDRSYLSTYQYMEEHPIGTSEIDDPFHYAPSLIRTISQTKGMEIGSHSYSHFYACAPGQNAEQFQSDLIAAKKVAELRGLQLNSFVFPKNQINPAYLSICFIEGIKCVRINPIDWYWEIPPNEKTPLIKKIYRTADAYVQLGQRKSYPISNIKFNSGYPYLIPTSRLLRPYQTTFPVLNEIRMRRILNEMNLAAQQNEVYHLWWHPHNFGHFPKESMEGLYRILDHFNNLQKNYGMISLNMRNLTEMVDRISR